MPGLVSDPVVGFASGLSTLQNGQSFDLDLYLFLGSIFIASSTSFGIGFFYGR